MEPPDRPQGAEHQYAVCSLESIQAITINIFNSNRISIWMKVTINQAVREHFVS